MISSGVGRVAQQEPRRAGKVVGAQQVAAANLRALTLLSLIRICGLGVLDFMVGVVGERLVRD